MYAVGWYFILIGLFSLGGMPVGVNDSVMLTFVYIVSGYLVIRAKELGRKLAIFLSLLNLLSILVFLLGFSLQSEWIISRTFGICQMQTESAFTTILTTMVDVLIVFLFIRPQIKERFQQGGPSDDLEADRKGTFLSRRVKELEEQVIRLYNVLEKERTLSRKERSSERTKSDIAAASESESIASLRVQREMKKERIGDILLEQNLVTKEVLDKALEYQKKSGGSIIQYLLHYGCIDEKDLTECLSSQFQIPYLPLSSYEISDDIIKLVPIDIVEKYWLMPVDKHGDTLMVVMIDPLDTKVIRRLEELTGLKIRPFVSIISEISTALQMYYKVFIHDSQGRKAKSPPFFIDTVVYKGVERRDSIRYKTKIEVGFPFKDSYNKAYILNVSRNGFVIETDKAMDIGSVTTLQVNLPSTYSSLPIAVIVQVVHRIPLPSLKFEIGFKILKISKQELDIIVNYAINHPGPG